MEKPMLQPKLELQWEKSVEQVVLETFQTHREGTHAVLNTTTELDITVSTIYKRPTEWGICIKDMTRPCQQTPSHRSCYRPSQALKRQTPVNGHQVGAS